MLDPFRRRPDAAAVFEAARIALDEGRFDEAGEGFAQAIASGADTPEIWFNLGLVHKFQRRWAESVRCNRRAAEATRDLRRRAGIRRGRVP